MMTCREKIISEDYLDWVIDFPLEELFESMSGDVDYCYQRVDENIGIVSLHKSQIEESAFSSIDYGFYPDLLGMQAAEAATETNMQAAEAATETNMQAASEETFQVEPLVEAGVITVQKNSLNLTGRGVIVGFIDTGINWENEVFRREDGTTRILSVWDQTDQTGRVPDGFLYGSEYTQDMINQRLAEIRTSDANRTAAIRSNDANGHGTMMASIACGSMLDGGSRFLSPAYQSDIVMVKIKPCKKYLREYYLLPEGATAYQSSDIMMAMKYIDGFARALQRPVVICIALGSNYKEHAGTGVLSQYIDSICEKRSRVVVVTGGNEGNAGHHFRKELDMTNLVGRMEIDVSTESKGFLLHMYASVPSKLTFTLRTPTGEVVRPTPMLFQRMLRYRFLYEKTTISVYNAQIDQYSSGEFILIRFENPTAGIWTLEIKDTNQNQATVTTVDAWLPIREFIDTEVTFLEPEIETTMTTPAYARQAMTVSTYNSFMQSFYLNSGRGFGRTGEIKPDIAVPGVNLSAASNRLGEKVRIRSFTGGSVATAFLAGIAAQFMQWAVVDRNAPYIRSNEVTNYFISGAKRDRNMYYPNPQWGFGKVDLAEVFTFLARCLVVVLLPWNI